MEMYENSWLGIKKKPKKTESGADNGVDTVVKKTDQVVVDKPMQTVGYTPYEFKAEGLVADRHDLRTNCYMALKMEMSVYLNEKYRQYIDVICSTEDVNLSKFYGDIANILNRLYNVLIDPDLINLRRVSETIRLDINSGLYSSSYNAEMEILCKCINLIDRNILNLVSDMMEKNTQIRLNRNAGCFAFINDYFRRVKKAPFASVVDLLECSYGSIYEYVRINQKETITNGKKY